MAKRVIRCAIRRRSLSLYLVFMSWPFIVIFLVAVASALFLPAWFLWLVALLSITKAIDRIMVADAAWKRRGRQEDQSTP